MSGFFTVWKRELTSFFYNPMGYLIIMFFLVVLGYSFWLESILLAQGPAGVTVMQELFSSLFFWMALLVTVPVITMRQFAEEKRSGTFETLMTTPISDVGVVFGKFLGAVTFFIIMWLPTVAYYFILKKYSSAEMPPDMGPLLGGYTGALLIGLFYISVGLLASALTGNQVVSAMICFAVISLCLFAGFVPYFSTDPTVQHIGKYISTVEHMRDFSRGIIDSRAVVLYVSLAAFMLFATVKAIESRQWK